MYSMLPAMVLSFLVRPSLSMDLLTPKSMILISPDYVNMMFSGFKSLCTIPCECI